MQSVEAVLIQAGLLIAKPDTWTQGALARRKSGADLKTPASASAKAWDAIGAVYAVLKLHPERSGMGSTQDWNLLIATLASLSLAASRLHRSTIETINDQRTHADVLELFRAAIRHERRARLMHN
jgi:hypothetical protein